MLMRILSVMKSTTLNVTNWLAECEPTRAFMAWASNFRTWLRREVIDLPVQPILHPSPIRLAWLGGFAVISHPMFAFLWSAVYPQPYASLWLHAVLGVSGAVLVLPQLRFDPLSPRTERVFTLVCWVHLPLFFSWMYLMNSGSTVWLASVVAMLLVYYHLTDWRLATLGVFTGVGLAALGFHLGEGDYQAASASQIEVHAIIIGFAWACAFFLGVSSANLRKMQLFQTFANMMGITAHEMRTPLATLSMMGSAVYKDAQAWPESELSQKLTQWASGVEAQTQNMNRNIDTQLANARLLDLPDQDEPVDAHEALLTAVSEHPFRTLRDRHAVVIEVQQNFCFQSSKKLFHQVVLNLLKNALYAVAATGRRPKPGDIRFILSVLGEVGRVEVIDKGVGIAPSVLPRIFDAFFSTDRTVGHGLGLTFCRRVVSEAGGHIVAQSLPGEGARFVIEFPLMRHSTQGQP